MKKSVIILFLAVLHLSAFSQTLEELKKQREKTEKDIEYTNKLLEKTQKDTRSSLNKITIIGKQIDNRKQLISGINKEIQLIDNDIVDKRNNISNLEAEIAKLKKEYESAIYHTWKTRNAQNRLMYVFSGKDLGEVYRRIRYLHEFSNFRKQQSELLLAMQKDLEKELREVEEKREDKLSLLDSKTKEQYNLQLEQNKQDVYVKDLKSKERNLKRQLAQQQKKRDELSSFIKKIIEEQIKASNKGKSNTSPGKFSLTPEEKLVSEQFDKNKGKLPWPVDQGIIISKFGTHKNALVSSVTENNPGIDILTDEGTEARAVFKGKVSGVFMLATNTLGVTIRHGEYISFYGNLSQVYVKRDDIVDTKQTIGKIFTDNIETGSSESSKTVLYFSIYKGIVNTNPEYWLAR
ncbi:murein hydrolase activator EnvC family protein [Saccharicrinis sp. FJH62]|uniref:murein hydrolase activator EnvC family protein n=1 Tax=Saccharicrinis sp. FJH62 TaxID=3344657 RepID=UPI0035D467FF